MKRLWLAIIRSVLGAILGFFSGALIGCAVVILAVIVARSTFGLSNIRALVFAAALIGAVAGCFVPSVNRRLLEPWFAFLRED